MILVPMKVKTFTLMKDNQKDVKTRERKFANHIWKKG